MINVDLDNLRFIRNRNNMTGVFIFMHEIFEAYLSSYSTSVYEFSLLSKDKYYNCLKFHSRLPEAYDQFIYESLSPEYEDWARPFPKTAPDNFHLSRYGHLQIDYSFSWHSLDRLIRNQ